MKNLSILITVVFVVWAFISCDQENPEPKLKSSFSVSVSPDSVAYSGTINVTIVAENIVAVYLNGTKVDLLNFSILGLVKDTVLNFSATGSDNQGYTKSYTIKVAEKPVVVVPTRNDSLCNLFSYWKIYSGKRFSEGNWYNIFFSEEELSFKQFYYINGWTEAFRPSDNKLMFNGNWSWVGIDSMQVNGGKFQYFFTDSTLVRSETNNKIITIYKGYK
jgi:hypothetical protein